MPQTSGLGSAEPLPILSRRYWLLLLGVALGVRLVVDFVLLAGMPLVSDATAYSDQARDFLRDYNGSSAYYWPPGTSYVLALFYWVLGAGPGVARLAMICVSLGNVAAVVLLARRVLRNGRAVQFAGWLMALLPSLVFLPTQPYSMDVTMLGLLVAALGAITGFDTAHVRWLAAGGLGLALALAARPGSLSFGVALGVAAAVVARRRWRAGDRKGVRWLALGVVVFAVCAIVPLVPALAHNHSKGLGVTLSTNNEQNLLLGNNPYTHNYRTWSQGQHPTSTFPPAERRYIAEHFGSQRRENITLAQRKQMRRDAIAYITAHPATFAQRTANRARAFWGFDYSFTDTLRSWDAAPRPALALAALFEGGSWIVLAVLALVGLLRGRGLFRPGRLGLLVALVLAYAVPYFLAFSAGRWHAPVLGFIAIFAAAGIVQLTASRTAWREVIGDRAVLVAIVVFALIQVEYAYFVVTG